MDPDVQARIERLEFQLDQLKKQLFRYKGRGSEALIGNTTVRSGFLKSANFSESLATGWQLRPDGATINGGLSVTSIDIGTTHINAAGDLFFGCTVAEFAADHDNAVAYILTSGEMKGKNSSFGGATYQYAIGDNGLLSFGNGADGSVTFDGSTEVVGASRSSTTYTLVRDVYYVNMTVSTGVTVLKNGFRIFGIGTLTLNGTALLQRNGGNGNNASGTTRGTGGSALPAGYLVASPAGGSGGFWQGATQNSADSPSPDPAFSALNLNNPSGGTGGTGSGGTGLGGSSGSPRVPGVSLQIGWHLYTLLDIPTTGPVIKYSAGTSGGGGGVGGGNSGGTGNGGGGGGGGVSGGIIAIYFRNIVIGASASITATGGNGGNGGTGGGANGGGGGGGAAGNGGQIILVYNTLSGSTSSSWVAGGTGGTGGAKIGTGTAGSAGQNGSVGNIRLFQISL